MGDRERPKTISLSVRYVLTDKDGKILRRSRWRRSRSFVLQFLEICYAQLYATSINITYITGAEDVWSLNAPMVANSPSGYAGGGIVVGTGTNAPANTDYALQTLIAHGSGSGQLLYGAQSWVQPAVVGSNVDMIGTRSFTNNSGATITIREVGCYFGESIYNGVQRCTIRDLLTISVANGVTVTIEYRLRTTV